MTMIFYNFLSLAVEALKIFCVMNGFFNYKFKKSIVSLIIAIITGVAVILTGIFAPQIFFANDFPLINIPLILAIAFSLKGSYSIIVSILCFFAISGVDEMVIIISKLIFNFEYESLPSALSYIAIDSVSLLIFAILSLIIHFTVFKKHNLSSSFVKKSNLLYLILFTVGEFVTFISIAPLIDSISLIGNTTAISSTLLLIISAMTMLITGFMLYYNAFQKVEYKELSEMNSRLVQSQSEYYQLVMRRETQTRQFRHDTSNHLYCLEHLLSENKSDEARTYISDLLESINKLSLSVKTGNFLINAILSDINGRYPDVKCEWNGLLPEGVAISNMDICTIFSNILQNAFRAAEETPNGYVRADAKISNGSLYLVIKNSKSNQVKIKNGVPETTKKESRNHGFGMTNAINCTEKNNGSFDYSFDDDSFTVEIVLPNFAK